MSPIVAADEFKENISHSNCVLASRRRLQRQMLAGDRYSPDQPPKRYAIFTAIKSALTSEAIKWPAGKQSGGSHIVKLGESDNLDITT
ncbi:hypothetical protein EVG20_g8847 [Dentipellis fragilis]|uniref:Uncharacterized protein n=1 Tax=Dentipellis fragilis TaxID=205917 RepID=A0A4Y9Y2G7_9AGAM|nr:hypothetical protein EVG20_g8847 [Dentipellis fragilis]